MSAMKSYLYSSPAVQPFTGNDDYGSPRVPAGRRRAITPSGPSTVQGQSFIGDEQQQQAAMPFEQQTRMQNSGQLARAPSLGSTLGRTRALANDPVTGAIAARMPGNAPYADILSAGMAPQLQSNQMGAVNVQNAQAMAPFYPQMAQQQVRGATIQNNSAESVQPFLPQQAQADVGKTNAEAGAITAGADAGVGQLKQVQDELRQHRIENQALRQQLAKYQQQEQQAAANANKPAAAQKPVSLTEPENEAARKVGYGGVMAMRQGKAPGDPTTQPSYQPPQQQQPATQPTADMGYQQSQQVAQGVLHPDGNSGELNGEKYVKGADGNFHKVARSTTQPTR